MTERVLQADLSAFTSVRDHLLSHTHLTCDHTLPACTRACTPAPPTLPRCVRTAAVHHVTWLSPQVREELLSIFSSLVPTKQLAIECVDPSCVSAGLTFKVRRVDVA